MQLQFLGATRQVTGSQYCLQLDGTRVLVDCGMFQERPYLDRNWEPGPVAPKDVAAVLLTHAHIDHCGLLPRWVHQGFHGRVLATAATADLAEVVLRDSARIQAEDIRFKQERHRKEGRRPVHPEVTLYDERDVDRTISRFQRVQYGAPVEIAAGLTATFHDAGHILGSAMIEFAAQSDGRSRRIVFSGDIGQFDKPILSDPTLFPQADFVVMESTYGTRGHENHGDVEGELAGIIRETTARGGNVVIPIFAIERAQELIYHLGRLVRADAIGALDVYIDSPMAASVTSLFARHAECLTPAMREAVAEGPSPLNFPGLHTLRTAEESRKINARREPAVIMATSGMCVAGRIKHHLRHNITRPECTILFVGYQGAGTLGRQILDGSKEVRIHGRYWPVRAEIAQIHGFSGHADHVGLMHWLSGFQSPPQQVFLTHGEEEETLKFAECIRQEKGWQVSVPEFRQVVELG